MPFLGIFYAVKRQRKNAFPLKIKIISTEPYREHDTTG
jgi:hypothetical protein